MHTVKWFPVLYCKCLNIFYLTHRWDPNKYYHPGQSGSGSNGNKWGTPHSLSSWTGASPSDGLESYQDIHW